MTISSEQLDALERLDYTLTEARFLYLVATHSGYFTCRQFLASARQAKGSVVYNIITKAICLKRVRPRAYGRKTFATTCTPASSIAPCGKRICAIAAICPPS